MYNSIGILNLIMFEDILLRSTDAFKRPSRRYIVTLVTHSGKKCRKFHVGGHRTMNVGTDLLKYVCVTLNKQTISQVRVGSRV